MLMIAMLLHCSGLAGKRAIATRTVCSDCCQNKCLLKYNNQNAVLDILIGVQEDLYGLSRSEKQNFVRDKIRDCIVQSALDLNAGVVPIVGGKNFHYNWTIGSNEQHCMQGVCRFAFCNAYNMSHCYLEKLCADIKKGVQISFEVSFVVKYEYNSIFDVLFARIHIMNTLPPGQCLLFMQKR